MQETFGPSGTLGRETSGEVVLVSRLQAALERLNPMLPSEAITAAIRAQLEKLMCLNKTRADFQQKFEELIDSHNAGRVPVRESRMQ